MSEWISVKERMPKEDDYPIATAVINGLVIEEINATFIEEGFHLMDGIATHWMPLPPPPEAPR